MKRLAYLTAVLTLATAAGAWAEEKKANPAGGGTTTVGGGTLTLSGEGPVPGMLNAIGAWGMGKSTAQWYIESTDKVVGLSDAQKKAITAIIEARNKAIKDLPAQNVEKLQAASSAVMAAYKSNDQDAIAKAQKDYQDLFAPMRQIMKKSQTDLQNVLTAEQKVKLHDYQVMAMVKSQTAPIQLSDEQLKQLKAAVPPDADPQALAMNLYEAIPNVLTAEQKTTIAKYRLMNYVKSAFARANLTTEQMKQVEAAVEAIAKDQDAKTGWGWEPYGKLWEKVNGLLTEEQKKMLKNPYISPVLGAPGASAPAEKKPAEAKTQIGSGQFQIRLDGNVKGADKAEKPATLVLSLSGMTADAPPYWLGLAVEPLPEDLRSKLKLDKDQGLLVEHVAPQGPAAKGGLQVNDVLLKAGGKPIQSVRDLTDAVQQAKEGELRIKLIRDGQTKKVTVTPAKRPADAGGRRMTIKGTAGGGLQIMIGESPQGTEGARVTLSNPQARAAAAPGDTGFAGAEVLDKLRDKVKRQHELAEKAWQIFRKMDALAKDKPHEANELLEQFEQIEGQLRQMFAPPLSIATGMLQPLPGQPAPGQPLRQQILPSLLPGPTAIAPLNPRPDPALQELRAEVQDLRRQVEQIKAQLKKTGERD